MKVLCSGVVGQHKAVSKLLLDYFLREKEHIVEWVGNEEDREELADRKAYDQRIFYKN